MAGSSMDKMFFVTVILHADAKHIGYAVRIPEPLIALNFKLRLVAPVDGFSGIQYLVFFYDKNVKHKVLVDTMLFRLLIKS
jgi:hypothetical protein